MKCKVMMVWALAAALALLMTACMAAAQPSGDNPGKAKPIDIDLYELFEQIEKETGPLNTPSGPVEDIQPAPETHEPVTPDQGEDIEKPEEPDEPETVVTPDLGPEGCTPVTVAFDEDYQKRVDKFSKRKLMTEDEYFQTPYIAKGAATPQLEDIIFEFTRVLEPEALKAVVLAFKDQARGFTETGTWTAEDVRRAIDEQASFDVCLPIPKYLSEKVPQYKFIMDKSDLQLYMYQMYGEEEILLGSFATTRGGGGFGTPTGDFWVKRIVFAPSYAHPNWSGRAGQSDPPGFGNPFGIIMAELWRSKNPLCTDKTKNCDGYKWAYSGATGIRFHTSSKDTNVRRKNGSAPSSHGCNRLFTKDGKRIFTLLYHTVPHAPCKKVARGTVCPFIDVTYHYFIRQ